jgi:hypothetical protein
MLGMDARPGTRDVPEPLSTDQLREQLEEARQANARLEQTIRRMQAEIQRLRQRLAQYEPEILHESAKPSSAPDKPTDYSLSGEERRRRRRRRELLRRLKRRGRRRTAVKFAAAERYEDVYPTDVPQADCRLDQERVVWRLENGRAVLVGYRVFRGPGGQVGQIPDVTPRCEYGLEILVVLAFLVYVIGISLDKAGAVMQFFCGLPLRKSQIDALLRQLAQHWEPEFEPHIPHVAEG